MASEWYYQDSGREVGPLSSGTLRQCASSGLITRDTLVRRADVARWVPASRVRGLFPSQTLPVVVSPNSSAGGSSSAPRPLLRPSASRPRELTAAGVKLAQAELLRSLSMFHFVSPQAQQILRDLPELCEFHLTLDLLSSRIPQIHGLWQDAVDGSLGIMGHGCGGCVFSWSMQLMAEYAQLLLEMESLCTRHLTDVLKQEGESGDGRQIIAVIDDICRVCAQAIEWELEVKTLLYYPQLSHLEPLMRGISHPVMDMALQLEQQMREQVPMLPQTLRLNIQLNVEPTREDKRRMERLTSAIEKLPRGY